MNKFYLIDKPLEITSFDILRNLKKKLNIKKMWHTWTLDPLATGLVLVAVGNYTKLISYLEKDSKTYEFELSLDWITESFDLAEKIEFLSEKLQEKARKEISKEKIQKILKQNFYGIIEQIPPKYSALKIDGQRAYKLAREWKEVKMKVRETEIFEIEILDFSYPKLSLKAKVSAWTYIRSIASDLWKILWTGAYITKLRRTEIGNLDLNLAQKLEDFDEKSFLDVKRILKKIKFINLPENILKRMDNWLETFYSPIEEGNEFFVEKDGEVVNIVKYEDWMLKAKRKI